MEPFQAFSGKQTEHDQSMFYWKIVSACQMSEGFLSRVHQYFDRRKRNGNLIFIFIGERLAKRTPKNKAK